MPIPNPRGEAVELDFVLPDPQNVDIEVFDVSGRRVAKVAHGQRFEAGEHHVFWNRRRHDGTLASAALYLVHLIAGPYVSTQAMSLGPAGELA